jgi:hypothetical protein
VLQVTPNVSWPDVVYYNSYTTRNMGWRIRVVDDLGGQPTLQQQSQALTSGATAAFSPVVVFLTAFAGSVIINFVVFLS